MSNHDITNTRGDMGWCQEHDEWHDLDSSGEVEDDDDDDHDAEQDDE